MRHSPCGGRGWKPWRFVPGSCGGDGRGEPGLAGLAASVEPSDGRDAEGAVGGGAASSSEDVNHFLGFLDLYYRHAKRIFFYLIPTGLANLLSKPPDSHRPGQFT